MGVKVQLGLSGLPLLSTVSVWYVAKLRLLPSLTGLGAFTRSRAKFYPNALAGTQIRTSYPQTGINSAPVGVLWRLDPGHGSCFILIPKRQYQLTQLLPDN